MQPATAISQYSTIFSASPDEIQRMLRLESYANPRPITDAAIADWHVVLELFERMNHEAKSALLIVMKMQQENELIRLAQHWQGLGLVAEPSQAGGDDELARATVYLGGLASFVAFDPTKAKATLKAVNETVNFLRSFQMLLSDFSKQHVLNLRGATILESLIGNHAQLISMSICSEIGGDHQLYWTVITIKSVGTFAEICRYPEASKMGAINKAIDFFMKITKVTPLELASTVASTVPSSASSGLGKTHSISRSSSKSSSKSSKKSLRVEYRGSTNSSDHVVMFDPLLESPRRASTIEDPEKCSTIVRVFRQIMRFAGLGYFVSGGERSHVAEPNNVNESQV